MSEFGIILNQVLTLLVILAVGYGAGKAGILNSAATKKLSEIVLYIASPMMVLNSFFLGFSDERLDGMVWTLGLSALMFVLSILLSRLLFRSFKPESASVLNFTSIFSNAGYIGLPLMGALFGQEGVFYGSFYVVMFNVFLWSYGFLLFGGKGTRREITRKVLLNPALIAVYAGLVIFLLRLPVPAFVRGAVGSMGNMTLPLSMLIIGGVISVSRLRDVFRSWKVYLASAVRLVLMPLFGIGVMLLLGAPDLPGTIVVTALAMPAATATTMFAELFEKDSGLAASIVAVSTILCLLTAPLMIALTAAVAPH